MLLAEWIRKKGEEFGSIYLVPYSSDGRRSALSHEGAKDPKVSRGKVNEDDLYRVIDYNKKL